MGLCGNKMNWFWQNLVALCSPGMRSGPKYWMKPGLTRTWGVASLCWWAQGSEGSGESICGNLLSDWAGVITEGNGEWSTNKNKPGQNTAWIICQLSLFRSLLAFLPLNYVLWWKDMETTVFFFFFFLLFPLLLLCNIKTKNYIVLIWIRARVYFIGSLIHFLGGQKTWNRRACASQ